MRPSILRDWPPCPPIQRNGGWRSRPGVNPFISALTVARCPATFPGVWLQLRDTLSTSRSVGRGMGLSYTPCLLMKPVLRLRLHASQSQPCFPAASNALALPGGNGIFTATPTERITHCTLRCKVVCQGASPFGNPGQQNRLNTSRFPVLDVQPLFCCQQSVSRSACSSL